MKKTWALFLVAAILAACSNYDFTKDMTETIFGRPFLLNRALFEYDSVRAFNGDGLSMYVFSIPDDLKHYLATDRSKILSEYPALPEYRKKWKKTAWKSLELSKLDREVVDFCVTNSGSDDEGLVKSQSLLKKILAGGEGMLCYFYNMNVYDQSKVVGDADFYLYSEKENVLIFINKNT